MRYSTHKTELAQRKQEAKQQLAAQVLGEGGAQVAGRVAVRELPKMMPGAAAVAPLALGTVSVLGTAAVADKYLELSIERQMDAARNTPPFSNGERLPPPPPFITPDDGEKLRALQQPLTTPATAPNVATSTPPFSTGQLPPPQPPLVFPNDVSKFDYLTQTWMATSREQALSDLFAEAAKGGIEIQSDSEAVRFLEWTAKQKGLNPENFHAITLGGIIFVRPEYADNVRVLREEMIHAYQQAEGIAHDERLQGEVDARLQMIFRRHNFGITNDEVREMINEVRHMVEKGIY